MTASTNGSTGESLHACTIVARNYLAQARVLIDTFRTHHPDGTFHLLLVDEPDTERPEVPGAEVVMVDEIGVDPAVLDQMIVSYQLIELATALKPWLLRSLIARGYDHAVYFDPDITIERRIEELPALARDNSVVLTPHLTEPMPRDGKHPYEQVLLLSGSYNLGFIAVGDTAEGRRMLDWWLERLATDSFIDHGAGYFTDQRLIDLVPGMFQHIIIHDPSWNFAYWNGSTRPLARDAAGAVTVGGRPATFFHFSGYSPALPHLLSKHQGSRPRLLLSESPILRELCDEYGRRLVAAGFMDKQRDFVMPFTSRDGVELTPLVRSLVRTEVLGRTAGPRPGTQTLAIGGEEGLGLADWLAAPDPHNPVGGLGRVLAHVYAVRPDLQAAYPSVRDGDREGFLDWAEVFGVTEMRVPLGLIRLERERLASDAGTATMLHRPRREKKGDKLTHGVEVAGYLTADLGLGGSGRLFAESLQHADVPISTSTYTRTASRLGADWTDIPAPEGQRFDTLLTCVNGDQLPYLLADAGPRYTKRRHHIGLWFWELTELPQDVLPALDLVDEIWTCSEYNAESLRLATDKPVLVMPHPAHAPARSDVRIPEIEDDDSFTFLFVFDQLSIMERKNPLATIEAFKLAFPEPGQARLVIKTINGDKKVEEQERLRYAAAARPDIVLVERYLSREELDGLMWGCDCYVSLHRAEGFGQTLAETMAIGKPVIATGYSGNLAFMNADNSLLVDYSMVRVPPGCEPYPATSTWAEPDVRQAADYMRLVFDDPATAQRLGEAAATSVAEGQSIAALAQAAAERLDVIWAERDRRRLRRQARRVRRRSEQVATQNVVGTSQRIVQGLARRTPWKDTSRGGS